MILAVGNLFHNKAHALLLDALTRVPAALPWRLAIAGRREEAAEALDARIAELGWEGRVQLLGPRDDIPDLLAACDVWVMPSLREALPMALLEAMLSGAAIVATAVGGIPEAIRADVDGLLVAPGDAEALAQALTRVLGEEGLRQAIGASAQARARAEYGVGRMIEAHEALYYRVARLRGMISPLSS